MKQAVWDVLANLPKGVGTLRHPRHPGIGIQAIWPEGSQLNEFWLVDTTGAQYLGRLYVQVREGLHARKLPIYGWQRSTRKGE